MVFKLQYILSLSTALVEGLFFSGLIFGWPAMSSVLESAGYFSDLCGSETPTNHSNSSYNASYVTTPAPATTQTCKLQQEKISLVYTVASLALSFSTIINGFIFDHFGTWIARVVAIVLFTAGCVFMFVSDPATSDLLFPAMCCFAVGGILFLITNMQLGNLFGNARSSVITLLNGALDSSSFVFLLVKLAFDHGIALQTIFQFMAACSLFMWLRTFLLMPRMHIPFPLPASGYEFGIKDCQGSKPQNSEVTDILTDDTKTVGENRKVTCMACLKTPHFWSNLMHLSLLQLRNYFFLANFTSWLRTMLSDPSGSQFTTYISAFGICQFFGVVAAPLNGFLIDGSTKLFKKSYNDDKLASAQAVAVSALATCVLGILFSIVVAIPSLPLQYLSFVLQVVFRSFLYGGNASFIAVMFPGEHFGKLYGITMTLGGIVGFLQFPLFSMVLWVFEDDFTVINIGFIVVSVLTLAHPVTLYIKTRKKTLVQPEKRPIEMQSLTTET